MNDFSHLNYEYKTLSKHLTNKLQTVSNTTESTPIKHRLNH